MKKEIIDMLSKADQIRIRQPDKEKIISMVKFARINAKIAKNVYMNEESAMLIFREIWLL